MKLTVKTNPDEAEEIVINCHQLNDEILALQRAISRLLDGKAELMFKKGDIDYYIPLNKILFFESDNGRTTAHTSQSMYYSEYKLYELEKLLGINFIRISKSCIVNTAEISAIKRNLAGASEVMFKSSPKTVYASRMYFKPLDERIKETRGIL